MAATSVLYLLPGLTPSSHKPHKPHKRLRPGHGGPLEHTILPLENAMVEEGETEAHPVAGGGAVS